MLPKVGSRFPDGTALATLHMLNPPLDRGNILTRHHPLFGDQYIDRARLRFQELYGLSAGLAESFL
ncbi:MAG: hypothetical protein ACC645_26530 [Pirellulales bacterium]